MSSHHDHDNHSAEPKEVSFRTPMILALVTVLIILLAVSTCDKGHGCCEDGEKCEAACESKHGGHGEHDAAAAHGSEAHETTPAKQAHAAEVVDTSASIAQDTTVAKVEEAPHH